MGGSEAVCGNESREVCDGQEHECGLGSKGCREDGGISRGVAQDMGTGNDSAGGMLQQQAPRTDRATADSVHAYRHGGGDSPAAPSWLAASMDELGGRGALDWKPSLKGREGPSWWLMRPEKLFTCRRGGAKGAQGEAGTNER